MADSPSPWDHPESGFAGSHLDDVQRSYLFAQLGAPSSAPSIASPTGHNQLPLQGHLSAVAGGTNDSDSFQVATTFAPTSMHHSTGFPFPVQPHQTTAFGNDNPGATGLHHYTTPLSRDGAPHTMSVSRWCKSMFRSQGVKTCQGCKYSQKKVRWEIPSLLYSHDIDLSSSAVVRSPHVTDAES